MSREPNSRADHSRADLDWQVYEYVSGELSAADEAAFEDRLAEEQSLREAVARIVETQIAVRNVEASRSVPGETSTAAASPAASPVVRRRRRLSLETFAGAVAALVVVGLVVAQSGDWNRTPIEPIGDAGRVAANGNVPDAVPDDVADAMVAYWSADQGEELSTVGDHRESADPFADLPDEDSGEGAEFVVPDWMLVAVAPPETEFGTGDDMPATSPNDPVRSPAVEN